MDKTAQYGKRTACDNSVEDETHSLFIPLLPRGDGSMLTLKHRPASSLSI